MIISLSRRFHSLHGFIHLILVAPKKSATIQGEKCHYSRRKVPLFTVKRALFNTNYNVKKMINYYNKHRFISKNCPTGRSLREDFLPLYRFTPSHPRGHGCPAQCPPAAPTGSEVCLWRLLHRSARIPAGQGSDQEESCLQESGKELQSATFFDGRWVRVTEIPHDYWFLPLHGLTLTTTNYTNYFKTTDYTDWTDWFFWLLTQVSHL